MRTELQEDTSPAGDDGGVPRRPEPGAPAPTSHVADQRPVEVSPSRAAVVLMMAVARTAVDHFVAVVAARSDPEAMAAFPDDMVALAREAAVTMVLEEFAGVSVEAGHVEDAPSIASVLGQGEESTR